MMTDDEIIAEVKNILPSLLFLRAANLPYG